MDGGRNPSLDGLRGVAVLLVLLYHHGLLNSGWLGVDVFFVLSGFLITGILRRSRTNVTFWRTFWTKRATRILPPLLLVLLLTKALSFSLSWRMALTYLLSLGDIQAYLRPGFEALRPLWSLAVEEHFYLLWPLAVRRWQRHTLVKTLTVIVLLEPLLRGVASVHTHQWELTYFLTPFRLDGLAMGALLAIAMEGTSTASRVQRWSLPACTLAIACWLGFRYVLGTAFTRDNPTILYNAACYSLVAIACAAGIGFLLTHPVSFVNRLLSTKPLVQLGIISYGVYLYQVPIHEAVLRSWPNSAHRSILIDTPIILLVAAFSFYVVERPIMRLAQQRSSFNAWPARATLKEELSQ